MTLQGEDRSRLIKLMMLTTSDFDGEALSAIRKANKLLSHLKMNWSEVLKEVGGGARFAPISESDIWDPAREKMKALRQVLNDLDISYVEKNDGFHFVLMVGTRRIDYWPTTGRVCVAKKYYNWSLPTLVMRLKLMRNEG